MIKNDAQKKRTEAQLEGFRSALTRAQAKMSGKRLAAVAGSYQGMIEQLEGELQDYQDLRRGALNLPDVERLDQVAPFITRIRIAKGISQTELARRLGVSKQVISRYEESDYQAVSIARLQEILDAVGIKTLVSLGG
jgi:HTH-type transcriptional regulator/antitoxin HigA